MNNSKQIREDINGLRAIAVVAVVLYHAKVPFAHGGFVGVDIFFVISGFLITQKLIKDWQAGAFSYAGFWAGRVRRLFPATVLVFVFSVVSAFYYLEPTAFQDFSWSVIWSVANVANWYFLSQAGYFDSASETKPLLHLWSLGVEAQFYLVFPFVAWAAMKWLPRRFIWILAALGLSSFLYAEWLVKTGESQEAFFNPAARFWELMAGGVLAASGHTAQRLAPSFAASILGLLLIAGSFWAMNGSVPFPGLSAVPPVMGTLLLIWGGAYIGNPVSRALSIRPMAYTGRISYGWYLWHWPLMVFLPLMFQEFAKAHNVRILVIAGIVAFGLAALSERLIERPIIQRRAFTRPAQASAGAVLATILVLAIAVPGLLPQYALYRSWLLNGERGVTAYKLAEERDFYQAHFNRNATAKTDLPLVEVGARYTCSFDSGNSVERLFDCVQRLSSDENVIIAGDSIARDMFHALAAAYPETNFIMLHNSNCPPVEVDGSTCFVGLRDLLDRIKGNIDIHAVLIGFRHRQDFMDRTAPAVSLWRSVSDNVAVVGATPFFAKEVGTFVLESSSVPLSVDATDTGMLPINPRSFAAQASLSTKMAGAVYIDVSSFWCPDDCILWADGNVDRPIFFDNQHLSRYGITAFSEFLREDQRVRAVVLGSL